MVEGGDDFEFRRQQEMDERGRKNQAMKREHTKLGFLDTAKTMKANGLMSHKTRRSYVQDPLNLRHTAWEV